MVRAGFMMTSSNGNIFRLLALCEGNPPVTGGFPSQRPVARSFDILFGLRLNKRLNKRLRGRWFDTPSRSLWRHCNVIVTQVLVIQIHHVWRSRNCIFAIFLYKYFKTCKYPILSKTWRAYGCFITQYIYIYIYACPCIHVYVCN